MIKTLETIIKASKTSMLVAFYNKFAEKPVTKFADRKTAEGRLLQLAVNKNMTAESFVGAMGEFADQSEINALVALLPKKEEKKVVEIAKPVVAKAIAAKPAHEVITDNASDKAVAAINKPAKKESSETPDGEPRKQNTPPHLNLRCPVCGYYAKTTPACLAKARLTCPVDAKHGHLLTAEERNEKRGR